MNQRIDVELEGRGWRKIATGTWYYDRIVPMPISVWTKPPHLASSRYDEDDRLDENAPIPATVDGFLYCCTPNAGGDHQTVEAAKAAADTQPWGPVRWD